VKLFQLNLINALLVIAGLAAFILIPSFFVQIVWNSVYSNFIERDLTIEIWQASLLWGAVVTAIYLTGIVRVDFQTIDSVDLDSIDDPELREKIQRLREQKAHHSVTKKLDLDSKHREEIIEHLKRSFAMSPDDVQELRKQMSERLKEKEQEDESNKKNDKRTEED